VTAILGGAGAALAWAAATLCAARSSRAIGSTAALAWVMAFGMIVLVPLLAISPLPHINGTTATWLTLSGIANIAGLLLLYSALGTGRVGVVAPIVAAEGGVTAVIAMLSGQGVDAAHAAALLVVIAGVVVVARRPDDGATEGSAPAGRAVLLATAAALVFGLGLYTTARSGSRVPDAWAVLPPRLIGVLVITLPLAVRGTLRLPREIVPVAVLGGCFEVAGFLSYAGGAPHGIAIAAVLGSLTGAVAAGFARVIHHERLTRLQLGGVALLTSGVAVLSALQA
jgi:drug/metabolite transporter (DMT)-like permease